MPKYQYSCADCEGDKHKKSEMCNPEEDTAGFHENGEYLFWVECKMADKPNSPKCPRCGGTHTHNSYTDFKLQCWVRGDGLVKDRAGARRDMNRHKLVNDDPYANMRQPGEVDHMLGQMRERGLDMGRIRAKKAEASRKAKAEADKRSSYGDDITEGQLKVLIAIDKNEGRCEFSAFDHIYDASGLLSKLMPDYVCKCKDQTFMLMAAGRKVVEEFTEQA